MPIQSCPTAMVQAPAGRLWQLLTEPRELQRWTGLKIVRGPDRSLAAGDEILFGAGLGGLLAVRFHVLDLEDLHRVTLAVYFPLGIVAHEVVVITPHSDAACRVTYN